MTRKPTHTCAGCGLGVFVSVADGRATTIRACTCPATTGILANAQAALAGAGGVCVGPTKAG